MSEHTPVDACKKLSECKRSPKCEDACGLRVQPIARPPTPVGWSDSDWVGQIQYERGKKDGWNECMAVWAKHMTGMANAIKANE